MVKDEAEEDPQKRFKMLVYQQRPTPDAPVFDEVGMTREEKNAARKRQFLVIKDHIGGYPVFSPDGLRWTQGDYICVPRAGDGGTLVHDPMKQRFIATSRRYGTVLDHFVIEWKRYRRVISICTSENFVDWSPQKTVIKPDDLDDPLDQFYVMPPCVSREPVHRFPGAATRGDRVGTDPAGVFAGSGALGAGGKERGVSPGGTVGWF